ncbi:hypothetical protein [Chitinophaga nivalis]|uniref:ADP-heptose--LPS heptosyltransferase n=1 Tax=Chitinophaga nivalis TaxID=2991709 RepID=A0ABT3INB7_9BACT|nr:hypothetical protein [Chitinophaga nivalis]MCW3465094.1 hypothetical protein [Chitinophaga nivalis]MCW3485214.1 hypothetical protein [Chitinophaga nivalis]
MTNFRENNMYQRTLDRILENNQHIKKEQVKKVLIWYEEIDFFIGDTCLMFDKFRICKLFFGEDVVIDVNAVNKKYKDLYQVFFQHNPNVSNMFHAELDEVAFEEYDIMICVTYDEDILLRTMANRCGNLVESGAFNLAVFSFTRNMLIDRKAFHIIFPVYQEIYDFGQLLLERPPEFYITAEEKEWANNWLREQQLTAEEQLFVILDSSSSREKLLRIDVYFDVLKKLLRKDNVKVLIFDEKKVGKEHFYREWLSERQMKKIIFSRGQSLREGICLLGSDYVKLIMGPCTGLVHCASGIYNNRVRNGMPREQAPVLITYTGPWDAQLWWGNAPLVNCLLMKDTGAVKELTLLSQLSDTEKKDIQSRPPCTEYTAEMLLGFVNSRLAN